ncbi:MAG: PA3496 family putative envelope integrity protein [Pseudomonas sp.]
MPRHHDYPQSRNSNPAAKTRRQLEDLRRMEYRRAIEAYSERRQLQQELADYPELIAANYLMATRAVSRRNAPPSR